MNYSLSSGVKSDCTLEVCSRPTWWIVFCRLLINDVQNTDIPKILERARPRILLRLKVFDFTSLQHCCLMTQICFSTILTYCRVRVGSGFKTYILWHYKKIYTQRIPPHTVSAHIRGHSWLNRQASTLFSKICQLLNILFSKISP